MRILNVRAAVITLIVLIVVVASICLLHSYQISRHAETFRTSAEAAWNETPRRDQDAIQYLRAYLVLKPKDYKAIEELGDWQAQSSRFSVAALTLEELVRALEKQDPPDKQLLDEVHEKLFHIYITNPQTWPLAEMHMKARLQSYPLDHPEQIPAEGAELLYQLGKCQRAQRKEVEAIATFRKALANDKNKGRTEIYTDIARTYQHGLEQIDEALQCMAEMIAAKPNVESAKAHHMYGMWLDELGGHNQEALQQAEIALKLKPDFPEALFLASKCALKDGDLAKAKDYASRGLKADPEAYELYIQMANVYMYDYMRADHTNETGGPKEAIAILKKGIETVKTNEAKGQLLFCLANIDLNSRGSDVGEESIAAAKECKRLMQEYHMAIQGVELIDARIAYAKSEWTEARTKFEAVRPKLPDSPPEMRYLNYCIGYCCLQEGNPDQAMVEFRRALGYDKYYFNARDAIAGIYTSRGAYKDAMQEYEDARPGNTFNDAFWVAYARAVKNYTLNCKEEERDWVSCARKLTLAKQHTHSGEIDMFFAEILLAKGKTKEARDILESLQKEVPKSAAVWVARANLEAGHNNLEAARKILDDATAKLGDDFFLRLGRATLARREQGDKAGPNIEKLATNLDRYSRDEKIQLLNGLYFELLKIGDTDRAKAIGRQLAQLQPRDAIVRQRLLELDLSTHNYRDPDASLADIDRLLDEIKAIAGEGPIWLYGKAVRLRLEAARGKPELLDEATKFAQKAQQQRVNWSRPDVLMGDICRDQGKDEEALQHYLQASVNGDRELEFNRTLLRMLFDRQRSEEAKKVAQRLESSQVTLSHDLAELVARIFALWGDFDQALQWANKAYDPGSDDYAEHLWRGKVLRSLARRAAAEGRRNQSDAVVAAAEKSLRKAIELAPTAPECRVELVLLLAADNRKDQARRAAQEAEQMLPSKVAPLVLGNISEALGENEKAAENYEKAAQRDPDNATLVRILAEFYIRHNEQQRAAPLIEKLLSGDLAGSQFDVAAARRMKATLLLGQGFPKLKEALALVEQNLKSPAASRQDRSLKVRLLLADPAAARTAEPQQLLEDLVKSSPVEPEPHDRFELARLYLRRGMWPECNAQMEKLVNSPQCDPNVLSAYVKMLLEQGSRTDAGLLLSRLEKVVKPGAAVPLRAELMFRFKNWGEISRYLAEYLDKPGVVPENRADRVLLAARLFEDFGKQLTAPTERGTAQGFFDEAGKLLEENAKTGPSGEMTLAAFYARRGRLPEAIDLLQRYAGKAAPEGLAAAAAAVINSEKVTAPQLQQLESLLSTAAAAHKKPPVLLTVLGLLKIVQGQPEQAEGYYRQVVAANPNDYYALNNLALLLAVSAIDSNTASGNAKTDEALTLINRAIDLAGAQADLLDSRAVVRISRHEWQQALEDLETILNSPVEKVNPVWLFHKAWALRTASNLEDARDEMAKARNKPYELDRSQIDPPERHAYDTLIEDLKKNE